MTIETAMKWVEHSHTRILSWAVLPLVAMLSLFPSGASAQNATSQLAMTFGAEQVTVTGASAGAQVVVFGIGVGTYNDAPLLTRHAETGTDDDGNGSIAFRPEPLVSNSVWVAVDLHSGQYVLATPGGQPVAPLVLTEGAWRAQHAQVEFFTGYIEVLVVRPGKGAWTARLADRGPHDADGVGNGVLTLRLERMDRLAGTDKGPPVAIPRDLIVAVDPRTLRIFVSEAR